MKTDDLIEALVEDGARPSMAPRAAILWAVVAGAVITGMIFLATMGYRPDIAQAAETYRFLFKFVFTLTLAATALALVLQVFRPEADLGRTLWIIALAPALLVASVLAELFMMPSSTWMPRLVGTNARFCLSFIPLLSIVPMLALFLALKHGAPANPGLAGALAGMTSSGLAATFYASHCTDDSPLFVAFWYSIAIALVTLIGYLAGRRWLAW